MNNVSTAEPVVSEETPNYAYPDTFEGPRPIADQISAISILFQLDPRQAQERAKRLPKLPEGAEGWFAVPKMDATAAKHFPCLESEEEKRFFVTELVLGNIALSRGIFRNNVGSEMGADNFRGQERTLWALHDLCEEQKGDILIIAAQLGMRHHGRSVDRARENFAKNEFGLDVIAAGSILLTHPGRLVHNGETLWLDCPGDAFRPAEAERFCKAPRFSFNSEPGTVFDMAYTAVPKRCSGPATAFLQQ